MNLAHDWRWEPNQDTNDVEEEMDEGDLQAVWLHNGQGSKHGRKGSPDVGPQGHGQHPGLL